MTYIEGIWCADFCPTGFYPTLALYCCLSSHYALLRLFFLSCVPDFIAFLGIYGSLCRILFLIQHLNKCKTSIFTQKFNIITIFIANFAPDIYHFIKFIQFRNRIKQAENILHCKVSMHEDKFGTAWLCFAK